MKYRTKYVSFLFMLIGGCMLIASQGFLRASWGIAAIIVGLFVTRKIKQHNSTTRKRRVATWDNPAANVLPYSPHFYFTADTLPPPSTETDRLLQKGVPTTANDRIWKIHYGARDIHPLFHIPDNTNAVRFIGGDLTSCKTDRTQCLPVPNIAISQKQNLTI